MAKSLGRWVSDKSTGPSAPAKPPGPILLSVVVVAVVVWICLQRDWWPSPFAEFAWLDPLLATASTLLVFLVMASVWAIRTLYVVGQDQRWSWWILPAPIVVVAGFSFSMLLPMTSFLDKRDEFEAIALELRETSGSMEEFEIGPFDVRRAYVTPGGEVYFIDNDSMFNTTTGWVYSPDGKRSSGESAHLDGPWYAYKSVWRD